MKLRLSLLFPSTKIPQKIFKSIERIILKQYFMISPFLIYYGKLQILFISLTLMESCSKGNNTFNLDIPELGLSTFQSSVQIYLNNNPSCQET